MAKKTPNVTAEPAQPAQRYEYKIEFASPALFDQVAPTMGADGWRLVSVVRGTGLAPGGFRGEGWWLFWEKPL